MKISISKKILLSSLSRIQGVVEKSSIKPLTSNALIQATGNNISFSATNLQIGITANYEEVKIIEEGNISVNARKIYEIIKEFPEKNILISEKENYWIEITCGESLRFNLIGLPPEDFPQFINNEENISFVEWSLETFLTMIDATSFSISRDETKLNICGAYLEKQENSLTRMVTTDGYRLSIIDEELQQLSVDEGFIIPFKAITEINRVLVEKREEKKIFLAKVKNNLKIKIAEVELYIRLLEKKFPDYKIIIPGDGYKKESILIKNDIIKPSLKRMSIISQENNRPVIFSLKDNNLEIFTEDSDLGNVKENIKIDENINKPIVFCINGMYLLDVLNAVNNDIIVEFNVEEENKPIIIKNTAEKINSKYIIMPMVME